MHELKRADPEETEYSTASKGSTFLRSEAVPSYEDPAVV
jgi:hypothetical protein